MGNSWGVHNYKRAEPSPNPTISQVAKFIPCDEKTVRRYIARGYLIAYRVGPRMIRIDCESVLKLCSPIGGAA